mmetsp:Transcript_26053/g.82355  ORF Transcript_26053/g.82355 Transcript_26053/m.82355 type:complete len:337 (+) Transcript_26053:1228-2238(+)
MLAPMTSPSMASSSELTKTVNAGLGLRTLEQPGHGEEAPGGPPSDSLPLPLDGELLISAPFTMTSFQSACSTCGVEPGALDGPAQFPWPQGSQGSHGPAPAACPWLWSGGGAVGMDATPFAPGTASTAVASSPVALSDNIEADECGKTSSEGVLVVDEARCDGPTMPDCAIGRRACCVQRRHTARDDGRAKLRALSVAFCGDPADLGHEVESPGNSASPCGTSTRDVTATVAPVQEAVAAGAGDACTSDVAGLTVSPAQPISRLARSTAALAGAFTHGTTVDRSSMGDALPSDDVEGDAAQCGLERPRAGDGVAPTDAAVLTAAAVHVAALRARGD